MLYIYRHSKGIMVHTSNAPDSDLELSPVLASPEDLEQVQANPLPRARASLEQALHLFQREPHNRDEFGLVSAQLSMAYVCLEDKDYPKALEYAELVLAKNNNQQPPEGLDSIRRTVFQRQQATARMYASEASCALGNPMTSMKYLVGDGKDDAFDRLASHLSGVTLETAASHPKGKARLAKAQAMVRCSASSASANLGNALAAKQLAMSAQAMEDAYSASREGSSARRTLVYCMLRDGNSGAALALLRSAG
jgi:tetratricopeptide (TPR) repeat protein